MGSPDNACNIESTSSMSLSSREILTADIDIDVSVSFTHGRLTYIIGEVVP